MIWTDLGTRARGLSTSLLPPPSLAAVDRAADRSELIAALVGGGYAPADVDDGRPDAVESAARQRTGRDLATLARWAGERADALSVVLEDEDRHSLRALLRGLAAGAPAGRRLAGCVPTPRLPLPVLEPLARAASTGELVAILARRGLDEAALLAPLAARAPLDLAAAERLLAARLTARARQHQAAGGRALAAFVSQLIDSSNAAAALLLSERGDEVDAGDCFLPGGDRVPPETFGAAATARPEQAREILGHCLRGTPLAEAIGRLAAHPGALDAAALDWQMRTQRRLCWLEPHGPAPVLSLVLARRAELRRVRRALWRLVLAPPGGDA